MRCCAAAAELGVAVEHNAAPERLDLSDRDLRLAKELGCRIVINTDSHDARNLGKMDYGIRQLRRAWLGPEDVLNTLSAPGFPCEASPPALNRSKSTGFSACPCKIFSAARTRILVEMFSVGDKIRAP